MDDAKVEELVARAQSLQRQLIVPQPPAGGRELFAGPAGPAETASSINLLGWIGRAIGAALSYTRAGSLDWVWLILAVVIAFWTGLQLYWIDKP